MERAQNWADLLAKLRQPFDPDVLKFRIGSRTRDKSRGMALTYIDARDVMERLDEVAGPENWQDVYDPSASYQGHMLCRLGIRCQEEWIWKSDGAGATGMESEKGSISDAFKRAAVKWGVGRYLYALPSKWVELENDGRVIARHELERLHSEAGARNIDLSYHEAGQSGDRGSQGSTGALLTPKQVAAVEKALADPSCKVTRSELLASFNKESVDEFRRKDLAAVKAFMEKGVSEDNDFF